SPRSIYPDSSNNFTKYLLDILVFLPLHDDSKMKVIQAYDTISPPQVVIALLAILPPSLLLSLSPMFDSQDLFPSKEISHKDTKTPVESPIPVPLSSSEGSLLDYLFDESIFFVAFFHLTLEMNHIRMEDLTSSNAGPSKPYGLSSIILCLLQNQSINIAMLPVCEPRFYDEEADLQRAVEESLKGVHDAPQGPLPPMVIREPDSGKFQPLPETPKKESPVEQYIFQWRTPASTEPSDEEVPPVVEVEAQDEGHAGPNPGVPTEGQAGSDPDVSTQLHPEQMDEGFTVTAYPNVQENCKLTVEEHVILEEPASSTGTLSSLQHLAKDFNFGDLFFNDKPYEAENEKTTAETKAESMVLESPNVHRPLQATATKTTMTTTTTHPPPPQPQQSTTDSMLIKHIGELEHIMENLIQDKKNLEERLDSHWARLYTLENLDIPQQKSMNRDHTKELLKDLAEARRKKKKRHDSSKTPPGSPPHQPPPPPPAAGPSRTSRSPGASGSSQVPPPPPRPPSTNQEGQSHGSTASSSSKTASSVEYTAWTTTDIRLRPFVSSIPKDLHMDDDIAPDAQAHSSDDDDIENTHIPKANGSGVCDCRLWGVVKIAGNVGESGCREVIEKQAGNVQTSLTLSSAKLEIQSMVDVPIYQEDPAVHRTSLIDTVISMVTDKTSSTSTPSTTQAHV
nr:hypothetical protein [Tanacetum cinerariifolium]